MRAAAFVAATAAASVCVSASTLSYSKVHLIQAAQVQNGATTSQNLLFRSNMPLMNAPNGSLEFAYTNLTAFMTQRALEAGITFPNPYYLQIISFDNILEIGDMGIEIAFAQQNPSLMNFTNWPLLGQLEPPSWFNTSQQIAMASNTTFLWGVDQVPSRLATLKQWLYTPYDIPNVFVIHCEAGCDRTGEFSGSWYMAEMGMNATAAWNLDTTSCGREPNFWAKNAFQWMCLTLEVQQNMQLGDCVNW